MLLWLTVLLVPPRRTRLAELVRTIGLEVDVGTKVTCLVTPRATPSLCGDGPKLLIVPLPDITTLFVSMLSSGGEIATVDATGRVTVGESPSAHVHGTIGIFTEPAEQYRTE
jgi:hypothetical protein